MISDSDRHQHAPRESTRKPRAPTNNNTDNNLQAYGSDDTSLPKSNSLKGYKYSNNETGVKYNVGDSKISHSKTW